VLIGAFMYVSTLVNVTHREDNSLSDKTVIQNIYFCGELTGEDKTTNTSSREK